MKICYNHAMFLLLRIFITLFFVFPAYAQQGIFFTPQTPLEFQNKKRITEILNRKNYGMIEPFFYVSNRPTIMEALADEIKNRTLVSPTNYMVYCPNGKDYFTNDSLNTGTIYIGAENLPKNGRETNLWFDEAYKYRKDSDPYVKPANVAIISATRQNFLRVRCPNTHNNIIVSSAPALAPIIQQEAQLNIDTVKNLRYADNPDITWRTDDYTLPSHLKDGYIKNEIQTTGTLKRQEINPPEIYINIARNSSSKHGILLKFLLAIAEVASEYNQNKISDRGTKLGIMQLSSDIAEYYRYDRDDLFNLEKSFDIASLYIKDLNKNYNGDINNIVRAYYMGLLPNNITTQPADTPETRIFATEITRRIDVNQPIIF